MKDSKDRGDSELVSLVLLIPLIVGILFTMIDMSVYFSNRAQIQSAARDAARTVASWEEMAHPLVEPPSK